ncbi:MAG TPA: PAS domain S-box protein [Rhizomicrobium sp.]|nr:PAS domain S-box protein [Rhizomicrobium sp.]
MTRTIATGITEAEQRLAAIVESSDDAIVSKDLNGIIKTWNRAAERMFGYTADEIVGKSVLTIIPEELHNEEPMILGRIRRGERIGHYDTVRRRKDGSLIDVSLTVSPLRDADGNVVGASKIARDISERKRAEERQNLLLGEMSHRVKNVLAVATGLVALSARSAESPRAMATAIQERLAAYARAHDLTRPGIINGAEGIARETTLHALIGAILAPYMGPATPNSRDAITVEGTDIPLSGGAVTNLALVLHEFATNAAKYGALSVPEGRIHIGATIDAGTFHLLWKESGGPAIAAAPAKQGFGSQFTARTIKSQFGGSLVQDWEPDGVNIRLSIPTDRLAHSPG